MELTCELCHNVFESHKSHEQYPSYCSNCIKDSLDLQKLSDSPSPSSLAVCQFCSGEFSYSASAKPPSFCSICNDAIKGSKKPNICRQCGQEFEYNRPGRVPFSCPRCRDIDISTPTTTKPRKPLDLVPPAFVRAAAIHEHSTELDMLSSAIDAVVYENSQLLETLPILQNRNSYLRSQVELWRDIIVDFRVRFPEAHIAASDLCLDVLHR
ncbi:hypothetical protein RCL1_001770 [Eukaryota sp. TZLM3-RCL]